MFITTTCRAYALFVKLDALLARAKSEGEAAALDAADMREGEAVLHGRAEDGFALKGCRDQLAGVIDEARILHGVGKFEDGVVAVCGLHVGNHEGGR